MALFWGVWYLLIGLVFILWLICDVEASHTQEYGTPPFTTTLLAVLCWPVLLVAFLGGLVRAYLGRR